MEWRYGTFAMGSYPKDLAYQNLSNWSAFLQDSLDKDAFRNVTFACQDAKVTWSGLAILAGMSDLFKPGAEREQRFTVHLPDYRSGLVRKFLKLISTGQAMVRGEEQEAMGSLAKDLMVRKCSFYN